MNDIDDKTPLMSDRLQRFLWHRLFEIGGLAIFVAGLLLAAILISANSQDPSFNTASGQKVHNLLGPLGAEFATLLYDGFGIIAGLLSLILLVWGLRIMMQDAGFQIVEDWKPNGRFTSLFLICKKPK